MRRISVTGSSGSGKSTLSQQLSELLGAEHIELDALHHLPGWQPRPTDEFQGELSALIAADAWIVDGNYETNSRPLVWRAADTVVWLDLPLRVVMRQVIGRTLRRLWHREVLWNGNRERWWNLIDPRPAENVSLWALTRYARKRESMTAAMSDPQWEHLAFVRLRSRDEVRAFVDQVRQSRG
jgi:adenylate kinase family enzyme